MDYYSLRSLPSPAAYMALRREAARAHLAALLPTLVCASCETPRALAIRHPRDRTPGQVVRDMATHGYAIETINKIITEECRVLCANCAAEEGPGDCPTCGRPIEAREPDPSQRGAVADAIAKLNPAGTMIDVPPGRTYIGGKLVGADEPEPEMEPIDKLHKLIADYPDEKSFLQWVMKEDRIEMLRSHTAKRSVHGDAARLKIAILEAQNAPRPEDE